FKDFNEIYYIPETECQRVAETLISKIKNNPFWFNDILEKTKKLTDNLAKVFPFEPDSRPFKNMSNIELATYYSNHHNAHTSLYQYSRLPEALDRGKNYFTNYLKSTLRELNDDFSDPKKLNEVFEIFTFPEDLSIAGIELTEFIEILEKIRKDSGLKELIGNQARDIFLKADPQFLKEINEHREKWTFWGYHGYGTRALRDIKYFLEKLKAGVHGDLMRRSAVDYKKTFSEAESVRNKYFDHYSISPLLRMQFLLYSRIGAAKLYRRYVQLRNFYFLDLLIGKISDSLNVKEEILRNLLPDEVEMLLKYELTINESHRNRVMGATLVLSDNEAIILTGNQSEEVKNKLKIISEAKDNFSEILIGQPLVSSPELIKGRCRIVSREEELERVILQTDDILVIDAADPDYFDLMISASAVLTEQGGVTAHASTFCRENRIVSVIGINGLLSSLSNNDLLEVDTKHGTIKRIQHVSTPLVITSFSPSLNSEMVGNKAYNLLNLKSLNFNVPDFFCIPLSSLRPILQQGTKDSIGFQSQKLWDEINNELNKIDGELYAIRSSYNNEDSPNFSGAGLYNSELYVAKEDVINLIINTASELFFSTELKVSGSIIIQKMILGDFSGIVFSKNPISTDNELLLEAIPGGNDALTDNKVTPSQYVVNRDNLGIKEVSQTTIWKQLLGDSEIKEISETCLNIEKVFGSGRVKA
ncbi:MAG: hypothetical protein EOO43_10325, partial [Flavobacterium sp.]